MRLPAPDTIKSTVMLVALAGLGYALWRTWQASGKAVESVSQAAEVVSQAVTEAVTVDLNPANPQNVVNRGVSAVGEAVTGEADWSLGSYVYDLLHPNEFANLTAPTPPRNTGGATGSW